MHRIVLTLLFLAFVAVNAQTSTCSFTTPNGYTYDFTNLINKTDNYYVQDNSTGDEYWINVCTPLVNFTCNDDTDSNGCQKVAGKLLSIGQYTHYNFSVQGNFGALLYANGTDGRSFYIDFLCDNTVDVGYPVFKSEVQPKVYLFFWNTRIACPTFNGTTTGDLSTTAAATTGGNVTTGASTTGESTTGGNVTTGASTTGANATTGDVTTTSQATTGFATTGGSNTTNTTGFATTGGMNTTGYSTTGGMNTTGYSTTGGMNTTGYSTTGGMNTTGGSTTGQNSNSTTQPSTTGTNNSTTESSWTEHTDTDYTNTDTTYITGGATTGSYCDSIPKQECIDVCGVNHVKSCACVDHHPVVECDTSSASVLIASFCLLIAVVLQF